MSGLKLHIGRFIMGLNRYSKVANLRRLYANGETIDDLIIRKIYITDIPAVAALHVKAWADTYWTVRKPPTFAIREYQWREQFKVAETDWCCFVAQNKKGDLIGFANGRKYNHSDLPLYKAELNKIYLLREYQHLGLGTKLLCCVAREFISRGINNMLLFSEANNPSGYFYEAMGAERRLNKQGKFAGGYGWTDLALLIINC